MTDLQKKQREKAYSKACGVCEVCGMPLNLGVPQAAHKIANTKTNRSKYGSFVIDNPLNVSYVCSLKCNDKCNIGNNRGKVLMLIADIITVELKNF